MSRAKLDTPEHRARMDARKHAERTAKGATPFAVEFKVWRVGEGLTQEEAGDVLAVGVGVVRDWEQGRATPSLIGPVRIAMARQSGELTGALLLADGERARARRIAAMRRDAAALREGGQ